MIHTRESLFTHVVSILEEQFDVDPNAVTLNSKLQEELDIDSIDAVNLMIELKSLTHKKIALENFHQVVTVNDLITAIEMVLIQDPS